MVFIRTLPEETAGWIRRNPWLSRPPGEREILCLLRSQQHVWAPGTAGYSCVSLALWAMQEARVMSFRSSFPAFEVNQVLGFSSQGC